MAVAAALACSLDSSVAAAAAAASQSCCVAGGIQRVPTARQSS